MLAWSGEGSLLDHGLLLVPSHGGRGKGVLWNLFYKDVNLILEGSALMT